MAARTQAWYNANENRSWPLDDNATLVDNGGQRLPFNLIVDLNLRFPLSVATRAYLAGVTVGPALVTAVICSSESGTVILGTVTLARPVIPYRQYVIESDLPGVGGWIVFGTGVEEATEILQYRFSHSNQALLSARSALKYTDYPIPSAGIVGDRRALTGVVKLKGGTDVETRLGRMVVAGEERDVAVIALKDKTETTDRNILSDYVGDCGRRPESKNCLGGIPVELFNSVTPDCCGNIFVELRGGLEAFEIENTNGVVIDFPVELADACVTEARLPDDRGRLPNEFTDPCSPEGGGYEGPGGSESLAKVLSISEPVFRSPVVFESATIESLEAGKGRWEWIVDQGLPPTLSIGDVAASVNYKGKAAFVVVDGNLPRPGDGIVLFFSNNYPAYTKVAQVQGPIVVTEQNHNDYLNVSSWITVSKELAEVGIGSFSAEEGKLEFEHPPAASSLYLLYESVLTLIELRADGTPSFCPANGQRGLWFDAKVAKSAYESADLRGSILCVGPLRMDILRAGATGPKTYRVCTPLPEIQILSGIRSSGRGKETLVGPQVAGDITVETQLRLGRPARGQRAYAGITIENTSGDSLNIELSYQSSKILRVWQKVGQSIVILSSTRVPFLRTEVPYDITLSLASDGEHTWVQVAVQSLTQGDGVVTEPSKLRGEHAGTGRLQLMTKDSIVEIIALKVGTPDADI